MLNFHGKFVQTDKILDISKLKAFADNKRNATQKLKVILSRVEITGEKEKMMVTSSFSFSLNVFKTSVCQDRWSVGKS